MVINNPIVTDSEWLQATAVAIQNKDGGSKMGVPDFASRITAISTILEKPDPNGALLLMDWEGTILQSYTHAEAMALESLPDIEDTPYYPLVDHELLEFQTWTETLAYAQDYLRNRPYGQFELKAIYTTTDGQNHNYWNNPRLEGTSTAISMQKRATTSIAVNAFYSCYSLTSVNIPSSVTSIGINAFRNCYSLTSVNIPSSVTSIGDSAFNGCTSLTSVNIPSSVTSIGSNAFNGCRALSSVNIPSSVTSIAVGAFNGCYSLTSVNIPSSVTSIAVNAFYSCTSLTSINIPSSVTSIGSNAFNGCRTLIDTIIRGTPSLSNTSAFDGAASGLKFYVPRANLSWFETATNWSTCYALNKVVAIEDYIEYLESIGYNVDEYKEVSA